MMMMMMMMMIVVCTPTPPLGPQGSGYQTWNSPMVMKRGSSEWVQINSVVKKTNTIEIQWYRNRKEDQRTMDLTKDLRTMEVIHSYPSPLCGHVRNWWWWSYSEMYISMSTCIGTLKRVINRIWFKMLESQLFILKDLYLRYVHSTLCGGAIPCCWIQLLLLLLYILIIITCVVVLFHAVEFNSCYCCCTYYCYYIVIIVIITIIYVTIVTFIIIIILVGLGCRFGTTKAVTTKGPSRVTQIPFRISPLIILESG